MLSALIATALLARMQGPYAAAKLPVPGASCYESTLELGYDNVPISNGRATTVTDIIAIFAPSAKTPAVWIYKNVSGQYWAQGNLPMRTFITRAFVPSLADVLARKPQGGTTLSDFVRLSNLSSFVRQAEKAGGTAVRCFTAEMPHKYAKDVVK